jgi:drug/metabolite transporter (DMT)-like permease
MISLNKNIMGIIFMTLGMFCLSVNDVVVKGLNISFPVWEIIFFRAFSGILVSFGLIFIFGWKSLKTKKPIRHFVRAFSAVGCVVFYFFGLKFLLLSENIAIVHSAPIFAALLAVPILGERLGIHRISAIVIGFIGVIIIVKPGTDVFKLVSILPLISALFMASVYLSTRSLMNTDSSIAIIFYYSLALLITSIVFLPNDFAIPNIVQLIPLMSLGVVGSLGHYFMSQAAKNAEVVVISPFEYSSFLFVGIMGYIFYNEVPSISIIIGGILIIAGGVYIAYREQKVSNI